MSRRIIALLTIAVLLSSLLIGCDGEEETTATAEPPTSADIALRITGKVDSQMGWSEEEVRAMDTIEAESTNNQGEMSTYTGVPIKTLLELAGVQADAATLVYVADDGVTADVPLGDVQACEDCIVSFRNQGGFSIVMPGFPGKAQVKGVIEIQVK